MQTRRERRPFLDARAAALWLAGKNGDLVREWLAWCTDQGYPLIRETIDDVGRAPYASFEQPDWQDRVGKS